MASHQQRGGPRPGACCTQGTLLRRSLRAAATVVGALLPRSRLDRRLGARAAVPQRERSATGELPSTLLAGLVNEPIVPAKRWAAVSMGKA